MKRRIGILTSGGDCPGLNPAIRGLAKASYELFDAEFIGINDGLKGFIEGDWRPLAPEDFDGLLTLGGTFLGTSRRPFRNMRKIEADGIDKVDAMKKNYKKMKLDGLVILGGNGSHKTANLLCEEGLNVIALPKTIDNDIYGTDVTFGFHTAVDVATDVIDRLHTTAYSHSRVMVVQIMGNKTGWLTLYSAIAGGADVILLPEIPYNADAVIQSIEKRSARQKRFSIVAIAEGAYSQEEVKLKRKDRDLFLKEAGFTSHATMLADQIQQATGQETRVVVPGHILRGGSPSPYDRILSSEFGAYGARLLKEDRYGYTVAMIDGKIGCNRLSDVAGITKFVPVNDQRIMAAKNMGIGFGD